MGNAKPHSLEHEHILSGIIKCTICGAGIDGNVNRKKHLDSGYYRDYFYYACKHRGFVNGYKCTYRKQWNEDRINSAADVNIYGEEQAYGRILKSLKFCFPVFFMDRKYTNWIGTTKVQLKNVSSNTTG